MKTTTQESFLEGQRMARRSFLRYAGASAAAVGLMGAISSCKKSDGTDYQPVDIGSGDLAVLNYAYALEQLEAAFYTQLISTPYSGITADERALLTEIRDHEVIHREFFKKALGSNAIPDLTPNFGAINFSDRASTLGAAKTFEDLGVAAYNGVGYMIQTVDYLALAGKIVSVEARHAALIRNLINLNFGDASVIDQANGLEKSQTPAQVIPQANSFLQGFKISAPGLGA